MNSLAISSTLTWVIVSTTVLWLMITFVVLPLQRRNVLRADSSAAPAKAGKLAIVGIVRHVVGAALVAGLITLVLGLVLEWRLETLANAPENIDAVVSFRDNLERTVDFVQVFAHGIWIIALIILTIIWFSLSHSGSKRRWNKAIEERKEAIRASLEGDQGAELRAAAEQTNPEAVAALDNRIEAVEAANRQLIQLIEQQPVLQFGDDPKQLVSIDDLRTLEATIREQALQEQQEQAEPGQDAVSEEDSAAQTLAAADTLKETIANLESELSVPRTRLDGSDGTLSLAASREAVSVDGHEINAELVELLIEARVKNHELAGKSKRQREPELLKEWLAAGSTSEGTIQTTTRIGQFAGTAALIAIFLGFVSIGTAGAGTNFVKNIRTVELSLIGQQGDRALSESLSAADSAPFEASAEALASDEETIEFMRRSFRVAAANSLRSSLGSSVLNSRAVRRQVFQLAGVEARREILQASSRLSPRPLDAGRSAQAYEVSFSDPPGSHRQAAEVLDEAFDRRINQLRSNERAWSRMRAAAARPATANFASDAIARTAFGTDRISSSHAFRTWADRASAEFATEVAKTGNPKTTRVSSQFGGNPSHISARDRRILTDLRTEAPMRIDRAAANYRTGGMDPGSLHRVSPRVSGIGSTPRPTSVYGQLFPTSTQPASTPGRPRFTSTSVRPSRISARSYGRVRFSGRIGGVLIGRDPEPGEIELDVVGLGWEEGGPTAIRLTITTRDDRTVDLGKFHPAIVHHAMAYAADGRVVTSTLPQPTGQEEGLIQVNARRVVVHPAFEDTAFACHAIQIDRFVDTYLYVENAGEQAHRVQNARQTVTMLGAILQIVSDSSPDERAEILENLTELQTYTKECGYNAQCFPVAGYESLGFNFGVNPFMSCIEGYSDLSQCADEFQSVSPSAYYMVDSGVREAAFNLDSDFYFLTGNGQDNSDLLWPIQFMVQAIPQTMSGQDVDVGEGWEPWKFPIIEDDIRALVADGVAANPRAQKVLDQMKQFVILQRFFRLALNGDLGLDFPLESMVELQLTTKGAVKVQRHERWNPNEPFYELLWAAAKVFREDLRAMSDNTSLSTQCRENITAVLGLPEEEQWPSGPGIWPFIGRFEKVCGSPAGIERFEAVRDELRRLEIIDEAIYIASRPSNELFACEPL